MIKRKILGYNYTSTKHAGTWSIETDYVNDKLYLGYPADDADLNTVEEFIHAASCAINDMRRVKEKDEKTRRN